MSIINDYLVYIFFVISVLYLTYLIRKIRGNLLLDILRISIYFIPFILPLFYYGIPNFKLSTTFNGLSYTLAICSSLVALFIQREDFKPFLSKDMYYFMPRLTFFAFISFEISLIFSPIFEELLYRYCLPQFNLFFDTVLTGIIFVLVHYIRKSIRERYTIKSYIILFALSVAWYLSYRISGSILPAILGHFVYNFPNMIITGVRYSFSLKESKTYST